MILATEIMRTLVEIIHETHVGLPPDDPTRLELVEIRPRSGEFSKVVLSCSLSPNDPAKPGTWLDEELSYPGNDYNRYNADNFIEMGLSQYFNLRFTIDFTFFFMKGGIPRDEALVISQTILARIHHAIMKEGEVRKGKFARLRRTDEYGSSLIRANNAVKKRQLRPGGDQKKPLYKGKMWLQFESFIESST